MTSVIVLQPRFDNARDSYHLRPVDAVYQEACALVEAIQLDIVHGEIIPVRDISPATLFGSGSVARIADHITETQTKLVFVNTLLSPVQQRNLERAWKAKVIDRHGLILDIFGARARTREGKLQVELAALQYQRTCLVKAWTHLERQRGGLGKTGGPGEMQKELDRRKLDERIKTVKDELDKVVRNRDVQRAARDRVPFPVVALVGYTNAGKSTLFNTLTAETVLAKDLLFATLDTTLRAVKLPSGRVIILSDTVGFIADLPPELVAAFRATLEETVHADIILHVRDIATAHTEAERADVKATLKRMNIADQTPVWEVWNKADLLPAEQKDAMSNHALREDHAVLVSAVTGEGCDMLLQRIDTELAAQDIETIISLPVAAGEAHAWLHRHATVIDEKNTDDKLYLKIRIHPYKLAKFNHDYMDRREAVRH